MNFEEAGGLIDERETGVVVLDHGFERRNNTFEEGSDVAGADQKIVDVEKHLQTVSFPGQLLLISLSGFKVEGIVDGDRHLNRDTLHEFDFGVAHTLRNIAAETNSAKAMLRRGERNGGKGIHAFGLEHLHKIGIARIFGSIQRDERLLILP